MRRHDYALLMKRLLTLAALCAVLVGVQTASAGPVPRNAEARIHAVLAPYDFYPSKLPRGLIFINWTQTPLSPSVCGTSVTIQFAAAGGRQIHWSSSRDCDKQGRVRCSPDGYPGYGFGLSYDSRATINGRRVFFSGGNHGSNAWACIPIKVAGTADWAVVGIWESNFITPRQAMNLVAYAKH